MDTVQTLTFRVEDVPGARMLSCKTLTDLDHVGEAVGRLFAQMYGAVGPKLGGPPICMYPAPEGWDPEHFLAVAAAPFAGEPPYGFEIIEIPACRAVVGCVKGSYERLPGAWREAFAWIEEQGLAVGGAPYERYRIGMGDAEPDAFETDIVIPLR